MEASPGCNHIATLLDTQTLPPCVLPPYHSTLEKTIMVFPVQKADFNPSHTRKKIFKLEMTQAMFLVRGLAAKQPGSSSLYLTTTFAVQPKLACYKMTLCLAPVSPPLHSVPAAIAAWAGWCCGHQGWVQQGFPFTMYLLLNSSFNFSTSVGRINPTENAYWMDVSDSASKHPP